MKRLIAVLLITLLFVCGCSESNQLSSTEPADAAEKIEDIEETKSNEIIEADSTATVESVQETGQEEEDNEVTSIETTVTEEPVSSEDSVQSVEESLTETTAITESQETEITAEDMYAGDYTFDIGTAPGVEFNVVSNGDGTYTVSHKNVPAPEYQNLPATVTDQGLVFTVDGQDSLGRTVYAFNTDGDTATLTKLECDDWGMIGDVESLRRK